jgi:hypothetical protein
MRSSVSRNSVNRFPEQRRIYDDALTAFDLPHIRRNESFKNKSRPPDGVRLLFVLCATVF